MFPSELATGLCSLNPRVDRLVLRTLIINGVFLGADFVSVTKGEGDAKATLVLPFGLLLSDGVRIEIAGRPSRSHNRPIVHALGWSSSLRMRAPS